MNEAMERDLKQALSLLQESRRLADEAAKLVWRHAAVRQDDGRAEYVSDELYQAAMLMPDGHITRAIAWLKRAIGEG